MTASTINDLSDCLIIYGLEIGFAERRIALANLIHEDGLSVTDLELLGDHCQATTTNEASAANVLRKLLSEPKLRDERLADLRKRAELQRAKQGGAANGDSRKPIGPLEGEDREVWDHDRQCRIAYCHHHGDRWPVEKVARELGVRLTVAEGMIDRGRVLCSSPVLDGKRRAPSPTEEAKAQREERQRGSDFRQRMRDDQARAGASRKPAGIDWKRLAWHKRDLLEAVRESGKIDLASMRGDRARALATLEADGHILRDGPPDAHSVQPYRIATSDEQRRQFRDQMRAWCHADMERRNARAAGAIQEVAV